MHQNFDHSTGLHNQDGVDCAVWLANRTLGEIKISARLAEGGCNQKNQSGRHLRSPFKTMRSPAFLC
jgi:hypothetical protein